MIVRLVAASAAAVAISIAGVALAQSGEDVARAEALFNAARQLREAGQYADACPVFAQSQRLAPGVGVSLYLADCYEHIGRTASAWGQFRDAEQLARARDDKRADIARARAMALEPKLRGLSIAVAPGVARDATEVLLDGVPVAKERWNVALAVDPGDHTVVVHIAGQVARTFATHVSASGETQAQVSIDAAPSGDRSSEAAPALAAMPIDEKPPSDDGSTRRWFGISLLAAGAVGVGLGTVILVNSNQPPSGAMSCSTQSPDTTATPASIVAFAAGGVALATGLALTVSAPNHKGVGFVAAPSLVAGGGGALVRGTF